MRQPLLKDIAYEKIKKKILRGDYLSRGHMTENELVNDLNMSRTPIRSALQQLQYEGFVTIYSNQGIVVQELSAKETNDLFDFRIAIETFALRKAFNLIKDSNFQELNEILERQRKTYEEKNAETFLIEDAKFHQALITITENEMFEQYMKNIRDRLFSNGFRIFNRNPERIKQSLEEHIDIVQALKTRNLEEAVKLMEIHLLNGKKTLLS